MSFAVPLWLLAGAIAAVGIAALHLLTRRDATPTRLPTARFIPDSPDRMVTRTVALSDRAVLVLRLLAVVAAALAFAEPNLSPPRRALAQIILVDTSGAADSARIRDAVQSVPGEHDRLVRFGTLSAGLIAAVREARTLRDEADSVGLTIVSPLARESFDAATAAVRSTWPAGIRWVPVEPVPVTTVPQVVDLRAEADDPLRSTLALSGWSVADTGSIRLVRTTELALADSAWIADTTAVSRLLIHWPTGSLLDGDTVGAVVTDRTVLVAPFRRGGGEAQGTARAWWVDGTVAAADRPAGKGCIRQVSIPIEAAGDLALRQVTRDLLRDLLIPCGGRRNTLRADSAAIAAIIGPATVALPTGQLTGFPSRSPATPWLLGLALAALLAEQTMRRRPR
ncbi:MAG: BatA domain-containing protein [Gemmatimonadales bacterium]